MKTSSTMRVTTFFALLLSACGDTHPGESGRDEASEPFAAAGTDYSLVTPAKMNDQ